MKPSFRWGRLALSLAASSLAGPAARHAFAGALHLWLSGWASAEGWLRLLAGLAASAAAGYASGRLVEGERGLTRLLPLLAAAASTACALSSPPLPLKPPPLPVS